MGEAIRVMGEAIRVMGEAIQVMGEAIRVMGEASRVVGEAFQVVGEAFQVVGEAFQVVGEAFLVEGMALRSLARSSRKVRKPEHYLTTACLCQWFASHEQDASKVGLRRQDRVNKIFRFGQILHARGCIGQVVLTPVAPI